MRPIKQLNDKAMKGIRHITITPLYKYVYVVNMPDRELIWPTEKKMAFSE